MFIYLTLHTLPFFVFQSLKIVGLLLHVSLKSESYQPSIQSVSYPTSQPNVHNLIVDPNYPVKLILVK
jgi:hypothetical protein